MLVAEIALAIITAWGILMLVVQERDWARGRRAHAAESKKEPTKLPKEQGGSDSQ